MGARAKTSFRQRKIAPHKHITQHEEKDMDFIGIIAVVISIIACAFTIVGSMKSRFGELKADIREIRNDLKTFEVTMATQSAEFRGIMAKQDVEFRGIMARQDAEFKMFLRCGRLPTKSARFRDGLNS